MNQTERQKYTCPKCKLPCDSMPDPDYPSGEVSLCCRAPLPMKMPQYWDAFNLNHQLQTLRARLNESYDQKTIPEPQLVMFYRTQDILNALHSQLQSVRQNLESPPASQETAPTPEPMPRMPQTAEGSKSIAQSGSPTSSPTTESPGSKSETTMPPTDGQPTSSGPAQDGEHGPVTSRQRKQITDLEACLVRGSDAAYWMNRTREAETQLAEAKAALTAAEGRLSENEQLLEEYGYAADQWRALLQGQAIAPWLKGPAFYVRKHRNLEGWQVKTRYHEGPVVAFFESGNDANDATVFLNALWETLESENTQLKGALAAAGPCMPYRQMGDTFCQHGYRVDHCPIKAALTPTPVTTPLEGAE